MNRLQQKYSLFTKLGSLFGPLQRLIEHPEQYNEQERAQIVAQYCDEYPKLQGEFRTFSKDQPGHDYIVQYLHFQAALSSIRDVLVDKSKFEDILPDALSKAQAAIDAIPIPPTSVILEAGSPFTAYCRLRELCEIDATTSLV